MQHQNWGYAQQKNLSDKDIANDLLTSVKHMSSVYHQGILEANSQDTRQAFYDLHDHTLEQHLSILEDMKNKGWYQPEMTDQNQNRNQQSFTGF